MYAEVVKPRMNADCSLTNQRSSHGGRCEER